MLLEGVPGLAKTLTVRTLATVVGGSFQRLQFTPDLLPADVTGTQVFDPRTSEFVPHKGPIFANLVLADEINRAPAKVQSALLEAMEERQVTIGDTTDPLPEPFVVLATQNPIEQEGTYPLPEAQLDRFLFKVLVDYPSAEEERRVLEFHLAESFPKPARVTDLEKLTELEDGRSAGLSRRTHPLLHRQSRGRHPETGRGRSRRSRAPDRFRGLAPRLHRPRPGHPRLRPGARTRLRDPGGRQGARSHGPAPPDRAHLRGRGRGGDGGRGGGSHAAGGGGPLRRRLAAYFGRPRPVDPVHEAGAELRAQVRRLEIRARQSMEAGLAGQYQSAFRGLGLEFEEVREYRYGDDVRTIDWNVTARTGDLHVKRYREERDLTVLLLVDLSASTRFGSGVMTVHDLIAEVSSLFALAAARRDRVGAILFDDVPPRGDSSAPRLAARSAGGA